MSKLFKFIENAIFEEDEQKEEVKNDAEVQQDVPQNVQAAPSPVQSDGPYVGQIRKHFAEIISEQIEASDIPGPDYTELKSAFESDDMKHNIPDANARWKTCFSMMKMMDKSLTKKHVLESIDVYVGIVDNEKKNALKQIADKSNSIVGQRSASVADAEKRIVRNEEEIKKLQEQINEITQSITNDRVFIETTKREIAAGEAEINRDKADLEVTAETIKKSLLTDKSTIESVLPND